jgi:hypothetical protein
MSAEQDLPSSEKNEQPAQIIYEYPPYFSIDKKSSYTESEFAEFEKWERDLSFIGMRINHLAEEAKQKGKMSEQEALKWVAEDYFSIGENGYRNHLNSKDHTDDYDHDVEAVARQKQAHEVLRHRDLLGGVFLENEPKATVFIPVAILHEKEETVEHLLELLSQQSIADDVEVVLWANYKREAGASAEGAPAKLERILNSAKQSEGKMKVRSMLISYADEYKNLTMSKLRKDAMDVLLMDGVERDFKFDHPVIWLDVDVQAMAPHTVELLAESVKAAKGKVVHPMANANVVFANDPDQPKQPENIAKAAAIHELIRRKAAKLAETMTDEEKKSFVGDYKIGSLSLDLGYPEESGFAINFGTYALLGGLNSWRPVAESKEIANALEGHDNAVKKVFRQIYPDIKSVESKPFTISKARLRTSNRRKLANLNSLAHSFSKHLRDLDKLATRGYISSQVNPVISYQEFSHAGEESLSKANGADLEDAVIEKLVEAYYSPEVLGLGSFEEPSEALQQLRKYVPKVLERAGIDHPKS